MSFKYEEVETECLKTLVLHSGKKLSQYTLYDNVVEHFKIGNDPILKNEFKYVLLAVIRTLSVRNNNITVENKNDVLYASFSIDETTSINIEEETTQNINNNSIKEDMPNNTAVIEFILENKLTEHYYKIDFEGNTILHHLINNNKIDIIKKHFNILECLIIYENNNGKTPIDLINNVTLSNFFIYYLIAKVNSNETSIKSINNKNEILDNDINNLYDLYNKQRNNNLVFFTIITIVICLLVTKVI